LSPYTEDATCSAGLKNFAFHGARICITVFTKAHHWTLPWAVHS